MLLTDPEVESSLLISLDEGASYQKYSLAFDILSLLFHPEQEDWILAYSHDQKVMYSVTAKYVTEKKKMCSLKVSVIFIRGLFSMRQLPFFFWLLCRVLHHKPVRSQQKKFLSEQNNRKQIFSHLRGFKQ